MQESPFARFWNIVKPPSVGNRPPVSAKDLEIGKRRRKLIYLTLSGLAVIAIVGAIVNYVTTAPQRAEKQFQEGMKHMNPGQYPEAIKYFNQALEIKPQYPEVLLERANAHKVLSEIDAALADYQAAADLNSSLAPAHNGIALIYLERHDTRRALEELNKSISLQPTTDAYYQRGQIFESQGDHQKAIQDYDQAIDQARDAPFIYLARALAKQNSGDEAGARADRVVAAKIQRRF
jgi:tetratricopeptide (TPR) repeat protein